MSTTAAPSTSRRMQRVREALALAEAALDRPTVGGLADAAEAICKVTRHPAPGTALRILFLVLEGRLRLLRGTLSRLNGRAVEDSPTAIAMLQRARKALAETTGAVKAWEETR